MLPRLETLRRRIREHNLDALLVSSLPHIRYLFGFTGSNALAIIDHESATLVTDRRYTLQAAQQVSGAEVFIVQKDLYGELQDVSILKSLSKVGVESHYLTARQYFLLREKLPHVELLSTENLVEKIAAIKDSSEVENIRGAARICVSVFEEICLMVRPGLRELDISAELSYRAMRAGSERDPFEPIVASGERSALPHGISSNKVLHAGDLVIMDFGATLNGYAADFTRTVVLGEPATGQLVIMHTVEQALDLAEQTARPGMPARDLDAAARRHIASAGFGQSFQHSLGHGLGLNVHEMPRISEFSNDTLRPGNVIALEPGIYVAGLGGVRIEDDFLVTPDAVENLTPIAREVIRAG